MSLTGTRSATTTSSGAGTYSFTGLGNGSYTVTPSLSGYLFRPVNASATVSGASVTGKDFEATLPTLASIAVAPGTPTVELGTTAQLAATGTYSDGSTRDLTGAATWSSSAPAVATVAAGQVTTLAQGPATIQASSGGIVGAAMLTVGPPGHHLLGTRGLYTQFERRGWAAEYWSGQVIQLWSQQDAVVGHTVAEEVALQLDAMAGMGVNAITFELRSSDPTYTGIFTPPECNIPPVLGLQFPQPTATELANLPLLLDLAQQKGVKVLLRLVNTHMEQQPPTNSATWLGAILGAIGNHPALDLVIFEGTPYLNGSSCGIPAEPPLWLGPGSVPASYVKWAIGYARSLGMPARKLSAEAIVGSFFVESLPPAGPGATGAHLWSPIAVMKSIFDDLAIPAAERTYAISLYQHRKCSDAGTLACTDQGAHDWADATLAFVTGVVGPGPRIVATEMGSVAPKDQWSTAHAVESLVFLMGRHGIDGGTFWRWTSFMDSEETDPTQADPVKRRGVAFTYNPVQREIRDMTGFHLPLVPNGSFEGAVAAGGVPERWIAGGAGTVSRYLLTSEPGQPEVPSRGVNALRLVTGPGASDAVTATSAPIPVLPSTTYTSTANLRFAWTGDPAPAAPASGRPQVAITILYLQESGAPSSLRPGDTSAWFQEDATTGFATFPVTYTTPADAARVQIQLSAARHGLPTPITLDADNLR